VEGPLCCCFAAPGRDQLCAEVGARLSSACCELSAEMLPACIRPLCQHVNRSSCYGVVPPGVPWPPTASHAAMLDRVPCRHPDWWTKGRFQGVKAPEVINTHCRSSVVLPDFLACKFGVHNGKDYVQLEVKEPMIGHKLGEFSPTRKHPVHKAKDNSAGAKRINPKTGKS
jgi:small subunit ribosomal protein S19